ncbi:APC family permease [Winogradskyella alexanderae]|uniref:Amino acid permease n=1 Tax=Winogradskyella alexanderae TaxID=2877123 RepID=A0ABS7XS67_9FLAO|nr:amino acid permease [Winogradskyella alexanderae]MCA0131696.1 amino acid permease [Winogradskyella alexanderae]
MLKQKKLKKITALTCLALVVANMIGTGAFTSLGFQLEDIQNPTTILILWSLGGVIALSGAFSYSEIGSQIQNSGGEYAFLSKLFHPLVGYLSGWISITVGFAAPIALSAIAFVAYFPFFNLNPKWTSIVLIALVTAIHTKSLTVSSKFQNISTFLKVALILILIGIGLFTEVSSNDVATFDSFDFSELLSPAFAIALIYVSYSYSGWNAAAYIIEEIHNPRKSLPIALIGGTLIVTLLYTLLQFIFLKHVPLNELKGQLDVGNITMNKILGEYYGSLFGLAISLLLISGISAMVWVGSRVTSSIAKDYKFWHVFKTKENQLPNRALWFQFLICGLLIITGTFEQILIYCGVLLTISSMVTVIGVFKLRYKKGSYSKSGYKSPIFPVFQIIYILLSLWMIFYAFLNKPIESLFGFTNLVLGLLTYFWSYKLNNRLK